MTKSPFIIIAVAFIIGIVVARYTAIPFGIFWLSAFFAIVSILFFRSRVLFFVLFILTVACIGGTVFRGHQTLPKAHIYHFTPRKGIRVSLEGIVDSDPLRRAKATTFILKAQRLVKDGDDHKICGKVFVKLFGKRSLIYGDRLYMEGALYRAPYFQISDRLNYRYYLEQQRIFSIFSVSGNSTVTRLGQNEGNSIKAFALSMKNKVRAVIEENMSTLPANFLSAIILGERHNLPSGIREDMVRSGTVHIIAISGLHVGLVSFILLMILKITRIPRKVSYVLAICCLVLYCVMTGARVPVVRVTIMTAILIFGFIIGRRTNVYNMLSVAACGILFYNPYQLFSVSFQLSFASIISIVALSPKFMSVFPSRPKLRPFIALFCGSLAAWIGLFPIIAYYFGLISPVAIAANMVVVPYLSIVVGAGFLAIVVGLLIPPLAPVFFATSEATIVILLKMTSLFAGFPGAYFSLSGFSPFLIAWYYWFVGIFFFLSIFLRQES